MRNKVKSERSENRKALPKLLGIILVAGLVGGLLGGTAGFLGGTAAPEEIVEALHRGLAAVIPTASWAVSIVLLGFGAWRYRQAKRLYDAWDGEDETTIEQAEQILSWVLLFAAVDLILQFFFFPVGMELLKEDMGGKIAVLLLGFILSLGGIMFLQQKTVDLTKKINPEKQGSVYDMKFQKKWLDSCDENERRQIGQAAYKAFTAVTNVCVALWFVLIILQIMMPVGVLPFFLVLVIWGVSQVTYCLEAIRLARRKG